MRKPICRQKEAKQRLEALIAKLQGEGKTFLPSERDLCEHVGTSRKTIQKALYELEESGILEAGVRGRVISDQRQQPCKGRLLFISSGTNWIVLPAWNRFWSALEAQAKLQGWQCEKRLYPDSAKFDPKDFSAYDFLVFSDVGGDFKRDFLNFAKGRDNIFGIQEIHAPYIKHIVTLDNREAGRIAARLLLDAGYLRPAVIRQDNGYLGFIQREEGFLEVVNKMLPFYKTPCLGLRGDRPSIYVREFLDKVDALCETDVDSVFAVSDELINLVYDPFVRKYKIPEEFGLVTLSGSYESVIHQPPVTAVTHASTRVAQTILEFAGRLRNGEILDAPNVTLVKPGIHSGSTIRSRKEMEK